MPCPIAGPSMLQPIREDTDEHDGARPDDLDSFQNLPDMRSALPTQLSIGVMPFSPRGPLSPRRGGRGVVFSTDTKHDSQASCLLGDTFTCFQSDKRLTSKS